MAFVRIVRRAGLSALPLRRRMLMRPSHRRRGMGQMLPGETPTQYYARISGGSWTPQGNRANYSGDAGPLTAYDYAEAPGCHVVDLSSNTCVLDDGTVFGCNGIQECDPLTGAIHAQFALPGGPIQGQPPSLKTVGPGFQFPIYSMTPNLGLKNPTGGTPSTFLTADQIQARIASMLGPTLTKEFQAAQKGGSAPSASPASSSAGGTDRTVNGDRLPSSGFDFSFLTKPVNLFGFGIPLWGLLAAGGAGLYAFSGSKR